MVIGDTTRHRCSSMIDRPRVVAALTRANTRVRLLCAPVGSGISAALLECAEERSDVGYLAATADMTFGDIGKASAHFPHLCDLLIDDADCLAADTLNALVASAHAGTMPTLLLAGHRRSRLRFAVFVPRGDAEPIAADVLAFNEAEIAQVCRYHNVAYDDDALAQFHHDTEGWAILVGWIIRATARAVGTLADAFAIWSQTEGYALRDCLENLIGADADTATLLRVMSGSAAGEFAGELLGLEALGYPIARTRSGLRPFRPLRALATSDRSPDPVDPMGELRSDADDEGAVLSINLFGRFRCRIGSKELHLPRRRDRQILAYLALGPDAGVSRRELAEAFWPGIPSSLALQGVRTSLYHVRNELVQAVAPQAQGFLRSGPIVSFDQRRIFVDSRRFRSHLKLAQLAHARKDLETALREYVCARRLYTGDLLWSEASDVVFEPFVLAFREEMRVVEEQIRVIRRTIPVSSGVVYTAPTGANISLLTG